MRSLVLQHVIRPQESREVLAGRSIDDIENEILSMIPAEFQDKVTAQAIVVPGRPDRRVALPGSRTTR